MCKERPIVSQPNPTQTSPNLERIRGIQDAVFAGDWQGFQTFLTAHTRYRVGNAVDLTGASAAAGYLREMLASVLLITDMQPRNTWQVGESVIVEYDMEGKRLIDRTQVRYPCVDLYRFADGKLQDWRVYPIVDQFITRQPHEQAEPGREGSEPAALPQLVQKFQQALGQGGWRQAQSYLTTDAVVRVANNPEVAGPAAFVQHIREVFSQRLRPTGAEFVNVWNFPDSLVVELIVEGVRVRDGRPVSYRCVETYRFPDGRIREYRIYPLEADLLAGGE
jgi:ketosteroid isomerase-like protein